VIKSRLSIEISQNQQKVMLNNQIENTPVVGFVMEEEQIEEQL
jgi:hypothetical protein